MSNLFNYTNNIGKKGEKAIINYYKHKGCTIEDVSNIKEYQEKDIDCIINGQTVEIKTGRNIKNYNELCLELVSNLNKNKYKPGWFKTTEAEIIIFYCPQNNTMYQVVTEDLRKFYNENQHRIKEKQVEFNEFDDIYKTSILAFVDINKVRKELKTSYREIILE